MAIDKGEFDISQEAKKKHQTVDIKGNPINLSARQKNEIYRKAKDLREKVKGNLCTRKEAWEPTDANVRKMGKELKAAPVMDAYKRHMRAIGADPRDCSTEKLRRLR